MKRKRKEKEKKILGLGIDIFTREINIFARFSHMKSKYDPPCELNLVNISILKICFKISNLMKIN